MKIPVFEIMKWPEEELQCQALFLAYDHNPPFDSQGIDNDMFADSDSDIDESLFE